MVKIFHGNNEVAHKAFQTWRKANINGFHMTEGPKGIFTIHYTQDKRENFVGRGCMHQGGSGNQFLQDKGGCYTTARKVCSNSLQELLAWANTHGYITKNCKHCDTKNFPFPLSLSFQENTVHSEQEYKEEFRLAEEIPSGLHYYEGAVQRVVINRYERDSCARKSCIQHYGVDCYVCGFNFSEAYGSHGANIIHVHHLKPISEVGSSYEVNPVADLRPVCPNCHAVIHSRNPAFTIEEVRAMRLAQLDKKP
jgi:hypothetical protein